MRLRRHRNLDDPTHWSPEGLRPEPIGQRPPKPSGSRRGLLLAVVGLVVLGMLVCGFLLFRSGSKPVTGKDGEFLRAVPADLRDLFGDDVLVKAAREACDTSTENTLTTPKWVAITMAEAGWQPDRQVQQSTALLQAASSVYCPVPAA